MRHLLAKLGDLVDTYVVAKKLRARVVDLHQQVVELEAINAYLRGVNEGLRKRLN